MLIFGAKIEIKAIRNVYEFLHHCSAPLGTVHVTSHDFVKMAACDEKSVFSYNFINFSNICGWMTIK